MSTNDPRAYLPGQLLHAMPTVYSDAVATPSPEELAAVQWHHDQFATAIKGAQLPGQDSTPGRWRGKPHYRLHVREVPCGVAGMDIATHWCISNGRHRTPWRLSVFAAMEAVRLNNWTRRPLVPRTL